MIVSDNAANSPQTASLSGTGVGPFTIVAVQGGSTSATVAGGAAATYNLSLNRASGFSGTVTLACSGAPQYATCSVSPSTLSLASGRSASFTVNVSTYTETAALESRTTMVLAGIGFVALFTVPFARRTWRRLLLPLGLLIFAAGFSVLSGCGGGRGGNSGGSTSTVNKTPAGTYTLAVTATAGTMTESQNLVLVVQ